MNNKNQKKSLEVINWIIKECPELLKDKFIKYYIELGMRNNDFSELQHYLSLRPELLNKIKLKLKNKKILEDIHPFYMPEESDFDGAIPVGFCINYSNHNTIFSISDKDHHAVITGKTQYGKTNVTEVISSGIISRTNNIVWIFTPDREYRILKSYYKQIIIIEATHFRFNMFQKPHHDMSTLQWNDILADVLAAENNFQQSSKNILLEVLKKFDSTPTVRAVLNKLKEEQQKNKNRRNYYEALINRFTKFDNIQIFSSNHDPDFELLQKTNIVFETEGLSIEAYNTFLSMMLIKSFYYRHFKKMNYLNVVIEECRIFFSSANETDLKTSTLLYSRAAKYGINIFAISQEPSSIARTIKANSNTMIGLAMTDGDEIKSLARSFGLNDNQLDFYRKLNVGQAIVSYRNKLPFVIKIPLFPVSDKEIPNEQIKKESEAFLSKITPKEKLVTLKVKKETTQIDISDDALQILKVLSKSPFTHKSDIKENCAFGDKKLNREIERLTFQQYLIPQKIRSKKGGPTPTYFELTSKSYRLLNILRIECFKPKGKGDFKHRFFAYLVGEHLKSQGWNIEIEGLIPNSENKNADVLAYQSNSGYYVYEICLNNGNLIDNIIKDTKGLVKKVTLVFESIKEKDKYQKSLDSKVDLSNIEFSAIDKFIG